METLEEILELSIKKNGDIPLTTGHLLNIIKMANRWEDDREVWAEIDINKRNSHNDGWRDK